MSNKTPKKSKQDKTKTTHTCLQVLTATVAAFLQDKHGLFLEVNGEKWLIHNLAGQIYVDVASDFTNFKHGLLIKLVEDENTGEITEVKPDLEKQTRTVDLN